MIVVRRRQTNEIGASFRRCETVRNAARCSSFRRKSHATNNTFTVATVDDSFCVFQPHRRRRLNRHHREEKVAHFEQIGILHKKGYEEGGVVRLLFLLL